MSIASCDGIAPETTRCLSWLCRGPLLAAAILVAGITGFTLVRLVSASASRHPWEATQVIEGWRSLHGLPVYEPSPPGHSTHPYGSLLSWAQGEIFRWVGPNNQSVRALSALSAVVAVTILALAMRGERSAWSFFLAWALIFGMNHRSGEYFADPRPDMSCLMFTSMGMLLLGFGQERRRLLPVILGSAFLVGGFFFKQTAFVFAAVPSVVLALRWRKPARGEVVLACFPLAVAFAVVLALRLFCPTVYHYMIVVPKAFGLDLVRSARCLWNLLIDSPLFLLLLGEWMLAERRSLRESPRILWLFATLVVTIPYSALTAGKIGGADNSLLPALLPMASFCALRLPTVLKRIEMARLPAPRRIVIGTFIALVWLMTAFPHMTRSYNPLPALPFWNHEYSRAIALLQRLPGNVVCPEDPTIPFYARGYVGFNVYSENDTHLVGGVWPEIPTPAVLNEMRAADYVLDHCHFPEVGENLLVELGFEPVVDAPLDPKCYRLWRRAAKPNVLSAARTSAARTSRSATAN
jgi:hypothetical protein